MEKADAKDYSGALKEFDKLADPRSGNPASIYYPKSVETILAVLISYEKQIEQMIRDQPTLQKMRDESVKKLIEPDLTRMNDAIKREKENWKTTFEQERKTTKWYTPYKYDLDSLKTLLKSITEEKDKLKELDLAVMTKVNESIARLLRADAKAGKDKAELAKMGEAIVEGETAAANADATSKEFYRAVFTSYRERYAYWSQAVTAEPGQPQAAVAGAVGGSSAVAGSATPGMDDKVAAALAAAAAGTTTPAAASTPTPAAGGIPAPVPGVPAPSAVPGAAAPGTMPAVQPGYPAQPGVVAPGAAPGAYPQQPDYSQPPAAPVPAPEEEGMSTMTMVFIGIGVVVVVVLLTLLGGGKKKK